MRRIGMLVLLAVIAGCSSSSTPAKPTPTQSSTAATTITTGDTVLSLPLACHEARSAVAEIQRHEYGPAAREINAARQQFQRIGDPVADQIGRELTGGIAVEKAGVLNDAVAVCRASHAFG